MTEREKAAAGFLYDANYDEELARQRTECRTSATAIGRRRSRQSLPRPA